MVERHHGTHGVESGFGFQLLHRYANKTRERGRSRIDTHGIKPALGQAPHQPSVPAADVKDTRPRREAIEDHAVKTTPPAIISHRHSSVMAYLRAQTRRVLRGVKGHSRTLAHASLLSQSR